MNICPDCENPYLRRKNKKKIINIHGSIKDADYKPVFNKAIGYYCKRCGYDSDKEGVPAKNKQEYKVPKKGIVDKLKFWKK